jgi:hypothetical protein
MPTTFEYGETRQPARWWTGRLGWFQGLTLRSAAAKEMLPGVVPKARLLEQRVPQLRHGNPCLEIVMTLCEEQHGRKIGGRLPVDRPLTDGRHINTDARRVPNLP